MYAEFFHWYFMVAPRWMISFFFNMQKALIQYFSVSLMLRTLFAHWRKDELAYRGDLPSRLMSFCLNQISRGIGFIIRGIVLVIWVLTEIIFTILFAGTFLFFLAWPGLIVAGFIFSVFMIFKYG